MPLPLPRARASTRCAAWPRHPMRGRHQSGAHLGADVAPHSRMACAVSLASLARLVFFHSRAEAAHAFACRRRRRRRRTAGKRAPMAWTARRRKSQRCVLGLALHPERLWSHTIAPWRFRRRRRRRIRDLTSRSRRSPYIQRLGTTGYSLACADKTLETLHQMLTQRLLSHAGAIVCPLVRSNRGSSEVHQFRKLPDGVHCSFPLPLPLHALVVRRAVQRVAHHPARAVGAAAVGAARRDVAQACGCTTRQVQ